MPNCCDKNCVTRVVSLWWKGGQLSNHNDLHLTTTTLHIQKSVRFLKNYFDWEVGTRWRSAPKSLSFLIPLQTAGCKCSSTILWSQKDIKFKNPRNLLLECVLSLMILQEDCCRPYNRTYQLYLILRAVKYNHTGLKGIMVS